MADQTLAIEWLGRRRDLVSPGVLSCYREYVIGKDLANGSVRSNRERKFAGEVWFYEKGLVVEDGARAKDLRAGAYAKAARLPWRTRQDWRPKALDAAATDAGETTAWSAVPKVSGTYTVWGEAADAKGSWRELGRMKLEAGKQAELHRAPKGAHRAVLALIDRRADRS